MQLPFSPRGSSSSSAAAATAETAAAATAAAATAAAARRSGGRMYNFEALDLQKAPAPFHLRRCTDKFYLYLFCFCWSCLLCICFTSLFNSPSQRITAGIDYKGRVCGYDEEVKAFTLLYWPAKQPPNEPIDHEMQPNNVLPVNPKP